MLNVPQSEIEDNVAAALREDIGSGDLTAALIPDDAIALASVITRENCVLCGMDWFEEVFRQLDDEIFIEWNVDDSDAIDADETLCSISGSARSILTGERTALNFLQTLSATATQTARYVAAIAGTNAILLDTRKTIPGLRQAQKYAVTCGGGQNHRLGLYDAILIKENHIAAHGSIAGAVEEAQFLYPDTLIEVEVENLSELEQALTAGANRVLLDNFSLEDLHKAVNLNAGKIELEASGGITLDNIKAIADAGVSFISTGALTKDIRAIDLSMRFL
jgi:nicotinate-nucleotide pyrophosphorylase (carboxylating)